MCAIIMKQCRSTRITARARPFRQHHRIAFHAFMTGSQGVKRLAIHQLRQRPDRRSAHKRAFVGQRLSTRGTRLTARYCPPPSGHCAKLRPPDPLDRRSGKEIAECLVIQIKEIGKPWRGQFGARDKGHFVSGWQTCSTGIPPDNRHSHKSGCPWRVETGAGSSRHVLSSDTKCICAHQACRGQKRIGRTGRRHLAHDPQ